jgi:hypothetical protein
MEENKKDLISLEKVKVVNTLIASIVIPVVVILIGNWYSVESKKRETQAKYVELAINILSQEPKDNSVNTRKWAIEIINRYSEVPITENIKTELEQEKIPKFNTDQKTFYPTEDITRAEFAKVIVNAFGNRTTTEIQELLQNPFGDVDSSEWYKNYPK